MTETVGACIVCAVFWGRCNTDESLKEACPGSGAHDESRDGTPGCVGVLSK